MWVAFLGFSADIGSNRQFNEALGIGAATWLVAAAIVVLLWWSGKSEKLTAAVPFVWWLPSYILMVYVVY
jgi:Na+-translocating ferredoxin:NAD+ oxidoreductase RnfA subunit